MRLGTRASLLARTQSATVGDAWSAATGADWEEVLITTAGDDTSVPLSQPGQPGVFVSALRAALLAGEVDVIVHSFKDLPSAPAIGIHLAAVPEREDARDALVSKGNLRLEQLPDGAVLGTSSPRRARRMLALRPDIRIEPIRGNVDTRIRKVRDGEYDATILAIAGMRRIGREKEAAQILGIDQLVPAPAQGALAIECRQGDRDLMDQLKVLNHKHSHLRSAAERAVLVGVEAECTTAVGAYAEIDKKGELTLVAELADHKGVAYERLSVNGIVKDKADAHALGLVAAAALLGRSSADLNAELS
jgi:hydroxymethylbilane synthase